MKLPKVRLLVTTVPGVMVPPVPPLPMSASLASVQLLLVEPFHQVPDAVLQVPLPSLGPLPLALAFQVRGAG